MRCCREHIYKLQSIDCSFDNLTHCHLAKTFIVSVEMSMVEYTCSCVSAVPSAHGPGLAYL